MAIPNKLIALNIAALVLHIGLLIAVVVTFYAVKKNRGKGVLRVYRVAAENAVEAEQANMRLNLTKVGDLALPPLLIAFCAVTVIAHAAYLSGRHTWYAQAIQAGTNPWRYLEYGISATIMFIIIAALSGARTVSLLLLIAAASVCLFIAGAKAEKATAVGGSLGSADVVYPSSIAWLLFAAIWVGIGYIFFSTVKDAKHKSATNPDAKGPPTWLWVVYLAEVVLFALFGVMALYYAKTHNFGRTELGYIVLSFVAKATLVFLLIGGLNAAEKADTSSRAAPKTQSTQMQ